MLQTLNQAQKSKDIQAFFQEQGRIHIVVDARREDVILPAHLKGNPALRLVLNCRMPQSIHFFHNRIESKFSFSGVSSLCIIPIQAIWAACHPEHIIDSDLMWEDDIPDILLTSVAEAEAQEVTQPTPQAKINTKGQHLRVVK